MFFFPMQEIAAIGITAVTPFVHTTTPKSTRVNGKIARNAETPLKPRCTSAYLPTKCAKCGAVISLGYDGYSIKGDQYFCEDCSRKEMEDIHRQRRH